MGSAEGSGEKTADRNFNSRLTNSIRRGKLTTVSLRQAISHIYASVKAQHNPVILHTALCSSSIVTYMKQVVFYSCDYITVASVSLSRVYHSRECITVVSISQL